MIINALVLNVAPVHVSVSCLILQCAFSALLILAVV